MCRIIGGMILIIVDVHMMSIDELRAFLSSSAEEDLHAPLSYRYPAFFVYSATFGRISRRFWINSLSCAIAVTFFFR